MKQTKLILLILAMLIPTMANADPVKINGIYYNLVSKAKTAEVTENPNGYSGKVVIPKTVTYGGKKYSVTSIGDEAFDGCSGLTSITIGNSVTFIGKEAFYFCSGLTSVSIPNSVTSIGEDAFQGCSGLTSVHIYDIAAWCNISFCNFASNPLSFAKHLYLNGDEIKDLVIPNSVTSIGELAFSDCSGLTSLTIGNSVTSIGDKAFYNCSGLTSVIIPNSVTSIGARAFYDCRSLTSLSIGNSVTYIGEYAFCECYGLTSVTIPNSVTSIGESAFSWCRGLTSVTIPNSVTSIGDGAFSGCDRLTSVTIPNSVTSIGDCAFSGCDRLTSVTIPNSVTSIGDNAFYGCNGLTSVTIPNSVTSIGDNAFSGCNGLTSFNVVNDNPSFKSVKGVLYTKDGSTLVCYPAGKSSTAFTIPNSVTSIGDCAFYGCSSLTSVTIPNSVTSIGNKAFCGCYGLTSVTIPNSVTSIGNKAFSACIGLTSVTIPNSVTSIGESAFSGCYGLTSVTIPNSVTSIGESAFSWCIGLTSVTIPNSVTSIGYNAFFCCSGLTSVTIPNSVTSIGSRAFSGCSGLTSVSIPNSVTSIDNKAFYGCSSLTSLTIPNSVTFIGGAAFSGCSGLTSITIGSGVIYIDYLSFSGCPELADVYCYAENVPDTYPYDPFEGSYIEYATLHVPKGCIDAYKTVEPWKNFKSIVEMANAKVKLSKSKATIEKGKTLTLKATVTPSDLSDKSVTWKSSNTKVATVTSAGKVKGVKAGTATITCTYNATGAKATCKVTVGYVKLDQTEATIQKGKTVTLKATVYPSSLTDKTVTWESSNTKVATVTSAGKVKGVKAGTATITCTSKATGLKTTCKVTVGYVKLDKTEVTLKKGKTVTLKATVYPSSLTDKSVTWKSSNTKIATVTKEGKIKGIKAGTATITCTSVATGLKGTCTVTVLQTVGTLKDGGDSAEVVTGINEFDESAVAEPFDVYDLSGHKVLSQVTSLDGLPNGIYIVNGKKILKK